MSCKHGNHNEESCDLCTAEEDAYARGVAAGRAEERERCAKLCESLKVGIPSYFEIDERLQEAADAIRANSK